MKICRVGVLLAGLLVVVDAISAQLPPVVSGEAAPVLDEAPPAMSLSQLFALQVQPDAPSASALPQSDAADSAVPEDRYRAEVESLAQNKHRFVHCKLKNGEVLTGTVSDLRFDGFRIHSNALGDGTYVKYKEIAELPRGVPAVGTRIKQGAQWTGFVIFVVVFFIPLAITGVIPSC